MLRPTEGCPIRTTRVLPLFLNGVPLRKIGRTRTRASDWCGVKKNMLAEIRLPIFLNDLTHSRHARHLLPHFGFVLLFVSDNFREVNVSKSLGHLIVSFFVV